MMAFKIATKCSLQVYYVFAQIAMDYKNSCINELTNRNILENIDSKNMKLIGTFA